MRRHHGLLRPTQFWLLSVQKSKHQFRLTVKKSPDCHCQQQASCWQSQSSLVRHWIENLPSPTWHTPSPGPSPAPQLAKQNSLLKGEKVCFAPYARMVSGGQPPRIRRCSQCGEKGHDRRICKSAQQSRLCSHCGSIEHSTEECASAKVEPELPHFMKKAQELPHLMLLEKAALMRSMEWTPEVCGSCWKHNPGHHEPDCPHWEMCFKCRGTGPYGYLHRHVCKLWPGDEEVFMQEDTDYEYWSRYEQVQMKKNAWTQMTKS
jgi:hypothetical protein